VDPMVPNLMRWRGLCRAECKEQDSRDQAAHACSPDGLTTFGSRVVRTWPTAAAGPRPR
jgi:hypothetical protein